MPWPAAVTSAVLPSSLRMLSVSWPLGFCRMRCPAGRAHIKRAPRKHELVLGMTPFIRLHPHDDVLIARTQLVGGTVVENVTVRGLIPPGHKVAVRDIAPGEPVRRYNQIIGFASRPIAIGEHVHTQNLDVGPNGGDFVRDYAFGADVKPEPAKREATFMGIKRADGRVATRNYIGVLSSVNCSATAARAIADHFSRQTNPGALQL